MSKFAWVTLATNDSYSLGALVVANSLKKVNTTHQTAVLITPGVSESMKSKLEATFNLVVEVNVLDSKDAANLALLSRPELGITFTKLHCWRLTQFEKCVFLDADTFVLQNCDELFDREELSAAPDVGWPDCFNSGVFVFKPSLDTFGKLVEFATNKGSFDGGDQGLLNSFFSDWAHKDISKHLPFIYNTCSTACYSYLPAFKQFGENVKILHFIGQVKPWLLNFDSSSKTAYTPPGYSHLSGFLQQWWNIFCADVHPSLTSEMGGLAGALAQLTLGSPRSAEQQAYEESMRRQCWEAGNIDYLGKDSFDNIWKRITKTIETKSDSTSVPPPEKNRSPTPQPEEKVEGKKEVKVGSSFNEAQEYALTARTSEHTQQQTITQITKEGRIIEKKIVTYPGEETTEIEEIEEVDGQTVSVKRSVEGGEKKDVKSTDKLTELKNQPVVLIPGYQTVEFDEKTNSTIVTEKTTTGYQQTITTIMENGKKKIQTKTFFDPVEIEGEEEEEETYEETETFEPGTKKTTVTTGRKDVVESQISEKSVESKVTELKSEVTEQSATTNKDESTTIVKKNDTKLDKNNKKESKVLTDLKNQPVVIVPGFQTVEFDEKTNTKTVTEKTTTGYQQTITTISAEGRTRVQTKIFYDPVEVSCEVEEEETTEETVTYQPSITKTTTERKDVLETSKSDKSTEITEVESQINQTTNTKQDQTTTVVKEDTEKAIVEVEKTNKKKSKVLEDLKKQPVVIVPGFQKVEFDETTNTTTVTEKTTTGYQQTITTVTAEGLTTVQTKVFYDPVEVSCEVEEEEETIEETVTYEPVKTKTTTAVVDIKDTKASDKTTEITEVESQINETTTNTKQDQTTTNTKQDQTTTVVKQDTEKAIVEVEKTDKKKSKVLEELKKQPVVIVPGFQKVEFDETTNTTTVTEKTTTGSQQTITTVTSDGRTITQTKVFYDPVEVSCEEEEETIEETVTYEPGTTKKITERKDVVDTKTSDKTTEITEVESQINQTTNTKQDQTTTVTKEDTEKALVEVDKKESKTITDLKNEPVVIVPGFQKVEFDATTNTTTVTEKTTTGYQQTITTVTTDGRTIIQTKVFYDPVEEEETYEETEITPATTKTTTTTTVAQTKNVAQSVTSATNVTEAQTTEVTKQTQEQTSKSIKQKEQVTTEAILQEQTDNKNTTTDVKDLQLVPAEPLTTVQKKTTSDGKEIEVTTTVSADGKTKTLRKTVRRPSEEIEIEEYEETQTYEPGEVKIITTAKTMPTTEETSLVEATNKNTVARVNEQQKISTIAQTKEQQNVSQIEVRAKTATSTSSTTMTTTHEQTQVKSQINVSAKVATSETSAHATQVKALTKQTTIEAKQTTAQAKQVAKVATSQTTTQATQVKALTKQTTIEAKQTTSEARQVKTEAKQTIAEAKQVKTEAKQVKTEAKQTITEAKQTKTDAKQIKSEGNVATSKMVTSSKSDEKDAKSKTQVKSVTASKKDETETKSKTLTGTTKKDLAVKSDNKTTASTTKEGAVIGKPKVTKKDGETTTEVVRRVPGGTEYTWTTVRADGTTKMESKTYFDEVEVECSEEEVEEYEEVTEETVPAKTITTKKPGPITGPKTPTVTDATPPSTPPLKPLVIGSSSALKAEHEILDTPPLDKAEQLRKKKLPSAPASKVAPKAEKSAADTPKPPPRKKEVKKPAT